MNDFKAHEILKENFKEIHGIYTRKDKTYQPTDLEYEAVYYLCDEWDYEYHV